MEPTSTAPRETEPDDGYDYSRLTYESSHRIFEQQRRTNKLLVAIAQRLDRNERSSRRLMAQQMRMLQDPLKMMEEFGDDSSYEDVIRMTQEVVPSRPTETSSQFPRAGFSPGQQPRQRFMQDGDIAHYRVEIAPDTWLRIKAGKDNQLLSALIEKPDGEMQTLTAAQFVEQFGHMPIFTVPTDPPGQSDDPTVVSLNPDMLTKDDLEEPTDE